MKMLQDILAALPIDPIPVRKVVIGVHWIVVGSKYCGLGSTLVGKGPHGHSPVRDVGSLHQKSAQELAQWILSDNLLEASIGIAALNSILDVDESRVKQINAAEIIARESENKNVAIVGHFPFIDRLKSIAKNCWIIEKKPVGDDFPEEAAQEFIPQADVLAITGTAFINHTMEELLSYRRPDTLTLILGPSTPLCPVFFNYGISFLSGSRVIDEEAATITIQQGATFPQVRGTQLMTMRKDGLLCK
ncbi:MAG TPA: DUF364 domain-containing protein [Anaerolineaceae bacterium]|nr:DUF364 domain-containing protein [Anaerolineaceae bacterium]HPN54120.1 DUF364 domain-containing protein [Anaerolineaceae bacterium]